MLPPRLPVDQLELQLLVSLAHVLQVLLQVHVEAPQDLEPKQKLVHHNLPRVVEVHHIEECHPLLHTPILVQPQGLGLAEQQQAHAGFEAVAECLFLHEIVLVHVQDTENEAHKVLHHGFVT